MLSKTYCLAALAAVVAVPVISGWSGAAEVNMLDEVVVSAGRIEQPKKDITANVTIIDRKELDQAVSRNVGDLFAEKGIGHIQKYPGSLTAIGIRGFRTETHGNDLQGHVLVLLDGRRAGTGNLAKILTANVERIEIIRGPGAVQYGSGGMGGVVNIITRRGTKNSVSIEGGAGSFGEYEGIVGATALRNGFDFAGTATWQTMDNYDTGSGTTYANTGFDAKTGISLNGGYEFSPGNRMGVIFTRFESDRNGNPGYINSVDSDDYSDKNNYSLDFLYNGMESSGRYQWMARYFFGKDENNWTDPVASNPDGWDTGLRTRNKTDQQGAQAQFSGNFGTTTLTAGLDWLKYEVENTWTPEKTEYTNPAAFLLGKAGLFDKRLILNAGLRYDWYTVKVTEPRGRDENESRLTPSVGLAWPATDTFKLRVRYAEGFVMPSADQLAADYVNWGIRTVGNPDLNPEKSRTWDGGIDYSQSGLKGSLTYFTTDFEDKIVNEIAADGSGTWQNLGSATINGFEVELSYDLGAPMNWSWEVRPYLNLTWLTRYEDNATGEDLLYISDINSSTGLVVADDNGFFCRFNVSYAGSQRVWDWEAASYPVPVVKLDSFTVADLAVAYRFARSEAWGGPTARVELRNIFDEDYAYVMGNPMPGRSIFAGLRWEY